MSGFEISVPYWPGVPERDRAWQLVQPWLEALNVPLHVNAGANTSIARNLGVKQSMSDVVLIVDAETVVPHEQILRAVELARSAPGVVHCFDTYCRLDEATTAGLRFAEDALVAPVESTLWAPPSHGCLAVSRESFWELGGYDERLEMFEDCKMNRQSAEQYMLRRVEGEAVHLWHPRLGDPGSPEWDERYAASRAIYESEYPG